MAESQPEFWIFAQAYDGRLSVGVRFENTKEKTDVYRNGMVDQSRGWSIQLHGK